MSILEIIDLKRKMSITHMYTKHMIYMTKYTYVYTKFYGHQAHLCLSETMQGQQKVVTNNSIHVIEMTISFVYNMQPSCHVKSLLITLETLAVYRQTHTSSPST